MNCEYQKVNPPDVRRLLLLLDWIITSFGKYDNNNNIQVRQHRKKKYGSNLKSRVELGKKKMIENAIGENDSYRTGYNHEHKFADRTR